MFHSWKCLFQLGDYLQMVRVARQPLVWHGMFIFLQSVFINVDVVCGQSDPSQFFLGQQHHRHPWSPKSFCQCIVKFDYLTVTHDMTCLMKHVHQLLFRTCSLVKCTDHYNVLWSQELVSIGCVHEILSDADTSDQPSGFILIIVQFIL